MFVEAEIVTNEVQKTALPIEAIIDDGSSFSVLVLTTQKEGSYQFEKQIVEIGLKTESFVEIIDTTDLLKSKKILVKGVFTPLEE